MFSSPTDKADDMQQRAEIKNILNTYFINWYLSLTNNNQDFSFSALTMLIGQQKGIQTVKKPAAAAVSKVSPSGTQPNQD